MSLEGFIQVVPHLCFPIERKTFENGLENSIWKKNENIREEHLYHCNLDNMFYNWVSSWQNNLKDNFVMFFVSFISASQ